MTLLSPEQIAAEIADLSGWRHAGDAIVKDFDCSNFKGSVDFLNRLTPYAEEMNHHPDVGISWATVTVTISTHSEGGLTPADFELARCVERAAQS